MSEKTYTVNVTLTEDDYWRIRMALAESAMMHGKAIERCKGTNQRSIDTILQHEHVVRRLMDVEEKLKTVAAKDWVGA